MYKIISEKVIEVKWFLRLPFHSHVHPHLQIQKVINSFCISVICCLEEQIGYKQSYRAYGKFNLVNLTFGTLFTAL